MALFKCKMCGGALEINNNETVATCEYCGTQQTLPKLDDDRRVNLYDRANHFRRNNEFDKAMGIYEQILNEDNTDAEAYWSLVLCRYGIEYVEDPSSRKRIPTVNRAQFTSIFDDDNYKSALQYADSYQRHIYEEEAKAINEIQKGILAISQKEEPFDVFICYKETDNNGRRTPDSVLAQDLYYQLNQEGFKVFFARITLEDKLGSAYEPYIFAALNSSKVMVVLGTKPEFFNAVWVKNEWSRYLSLIKQGQKKILIPAYKDMDPYDLPEEFSHLQAQDMSKLGFMQDLIRGIKKIAQTEEPKATVVIPTVVPESAANVAPLLKRAFMFLEDGDWDSANEYCEKVLDLDPECAEAYLGKLMVELQVKKQESLKIRAIPFDSSNNYQKAIRFADDKLKATLTGYIESINIRNENARLNGIYIRAKNAMSAANTESAYKEAAHIFETISEYQDSAALARSCYEKAEVARKDTILCEGRAKMTGEVISNYESAIKLFESISGWKDADEKIAACQKKIEEINAKAEEKRIADEQARLEMEREKEEQRILAERRHETLVRRVKITVIILVIVALLIGIAAFIIYQSSPASKFVYEKNANNQIVITGIKNKGKAIEDGVLTIPHSIFGATVIEIETYAFDGAQFKTIKFEGTILEWNRIKNSETFKDYVIDHEGMCNFTDWFFEDGFDCTKGGKQIRSCSVCKADETRNVNAGEHTTKKLKAVAPTCTRTGLSEGEQCTICGIIVVEQQIVKETGHSPFTMEAVAPTCIQTGLTEGSCCSVCATILVSQTSVSALGHTYGSWKTITPPTCTRDGYQNRRCSVCDIVEMSSIPATGHSYSKKVCSSCGSRQPSAGLEYTKRSNGYVVSGLGSCTDSEIVIADTYNGLNVVAIAKNAFNDIGWITEVVIPDTVTTIEAAAFKNCTAIKKIHIPNSVTTIGIEAFYSCSAIKEIRIPDSVTTIGEDAFAHCDSLATLHIGAGLKSVGEQAFYDCDNLKKVHITDIGAYAAINFELAASPFYGYYSYYDGYSNEAELYVNGKLAKKITIPGSTGIIGKYAFDDCRTITNVVIEYGVTAISYGAFNGCENLETVTIPTSVKKIENNAFPQYSSYRVDKIIYQGTRAQWKQLVGSNQFADVVQCTDGNIN